MFSRSFSRYRRRALAVFALGCMAVAAASVYGPPSFVSEAPRLASRPAQVHSLGEAASREIERLPTPPAASIAAAPAPPPDSQPPVVSPPRETPPRELDALRERQRELQSQLADLDARFQQNESESKSANARIASLAALLAGPPVTRSKIESTTTPPEAVQILQQLAALQSHEHELTAKMRDNHPQLLAARQQIADLQASLRALPSEQTPIAPAPEAQPSAGELLAAEQAVAQTLAIQKRSLHAAREQLHYQLADIIARQDNVGLDTARFDNLRFDELSRQPDGAVAAQPVQPAHDPVVASPAAVRPTFIQPASLSASKLPPGSAIILASGFVVAALAGLVTVIVSAARNPVLSTPRQLETIWDLPLAGSIPPDLRLMPAAA